MDIGEKIYALRREKNLSQGDLADMLEVSRQSVSKWENNTAVPDLQKIIRLSEIFEISVDDLIKGEKTQPETRTEYIIKQEHMPGRKIAGIILCCMSFLMTILFLPAGIIYASPLIICAVICFVCKNDVLLKCIWVAYMFADIFFRFATGTRPWNILYIFRWPDNLTSQKIAAVISFAVMIAIIAATVIVLAKRPVEDIAKAKKNTVKYWCLWGGVKVISKILGYLINLWVRSEIEQNASIVAASNSFLQIPNTVLEIAALILFVFAVTNTIRFIKALKNKET
ncbi:MAG: helix-turn-helix transcriptional regulator [Clostridia bacterium]|nr:helix-turn-helix transcriptional regulator [Clostridia bacterium]